MYQKSWDLFCLQMTQIYFFHNAIKFLFETNSIVPIKQIIHKSIKNQVT